MNNVKEDLQFFYDEELNNKFYFKLIFEIHPEKIKEVCNIVADICLEGIEFALPIKGLTNENGLCELELSTKPNARIENLTIKDLDNFTESVKKLNTIKEINWVIYNENNEKIYYYKCTKDFERFDYNIA